MEEDDDLQTKQTFLRENVLEKGYDAEDFMAFLQVRKGENGLDLNNWTMPELKKVVSDFVHEKDKESEKGEEEEINTDFLNKIDEVDESKEVSIRQSQMSENVKNDNIINNNIEIKQKKENNNIINTHSYNNNSQPEIEKCQPSIVTQLTNKDPITIKLSSPKKIEGGIFSKSFILYDVSTQPLGYRTTKRYSDFAWLRKVLSLLYANCVLPPLCKKNFSDRFTEPLINKRMRSIEKFMEGIANHPLIKNSELLQIFLSVQKPNEYKDKIQKYLKIKKAPNVARQIKTLDGTINIGIDKEKEVYLDNIKNYAQGNADLLQKITKAYKSLMGIMQQLSEKMKQISLLWKQVLDRSNKYYDSHNTAETFNIMSQMMNEWGNIQNQQTIILNENIREYFRYVKNEFNSLKDMANKVNNYKNQYFKANEKLLNTKEKLFQRQEMDTWQLKEPINVDLLKNKNLAFAKMLPTDTLKVQEYKNYYGAMLNSLIGEFERIRKLNAKRHKNNITKFIRLLSNECTNLHVCVADSLTQFNELRDSTDMSSNKDGIKLEQIETIIEKPIEENENNNIIDNKDVDEDKEKQKQKEENEKEENIKEDNKKEDKIDEKKDDKIEEKQDEKKEGEKEEKKEEENKEEKKEEKKEDEKKEEIIEEKKEKKKDEEKKEEKIEEKKEEKKEEEKKEDEKKEDEKKEEKIEEKKEDKKEEKKEEEKEEKKEEKK